MKLYVIGNGFDKAHGLKTGYWDFRTFLSEKYPEFLINFEKTYNISPLDDSEPYYTLSAQKRWDESVEQKLWSNFEAEIGNPDTDSMYDQSESIVRQLNLDSGPIGIEDTLDRYWDEQYGFVVKLQQYVKEWAEQIDMNPAYNKGHRFEKDAKIISFNYTDTLERVYHVENVFHVHGEVFSCNGTDPIIGHGNYLDISSYYSKGRDASERYDEEAASINNAIARYLENTLKDTKHIILMNSDFFQGLHDVDAVEVFGFSFGDADLPYISRIAESIKQDAEWTVYYRDPDTMARVKSALSRIHLDKTTKVDFLDCESFWK